MSAKKRCILLILLVLPFAFADSNAPDGYYIRLRYEATGSSVAGWDWTDVWCDTDPPVDADDFSGGFTCDQNIGTNNAPVGCSFEGNVQYGWRYEHESDPPNVCATPPCTGTYEVIPAVVTYVDAYDINWDDDQADCDCRMADLGISTARWNIGDSGPSADNCEWVGGVNTGPSTNCCCGDDPANEFYLNETYSTGTISDGSFSLACCDDVNSCVDDNGCYIGNELHDLAEADERGLPQSRDYELCRAHIWVDADDSPANCNDALYSTGHAGAGTLLAGDCVHRPSGSCWMEEGEGVTFGGYTSADTSRQTGCCGDDDNEFYISTNTRNDACCNVFNDFVYADHFCAPDIDRRDVYGYIQGQLPDGSYVPLNNIKVELFFENFTLVNYNMSNALGFYNVTGLRNVPGISTGRFYLAISAATQGYESPTVLIDLDPNDLYLNFTLNLTSNCRSDCTRWINGEFRCDKDCQGENTCNYDPTVTSAIFGGLTMQELCDGKKAGWPIRHNATHDIECCSVGYVPRFNATAVVEPSTDVRNAQTFYAGTVNYEEDGQFYGVYIVVYTTEQWQG